MPAIDGVLLDNQQDPLPLGPKTAKREPECPVTGGQPRARMLRRQDSKLLTKGEILQEEVAARQKAAA